MKRPTYIPALILLIALSLRLYALNFGLPLAEARPDELTIAFQAMKFGTFDFNPHSFNYPSLFKYIVFVIFGVYYAIGRVLGIFSGQEDFLRSFFTGAVDFRLLMRLLSALMGTVGVALLLRGRSGQYGAFFLAICFLHVRDSHFGVTDISMITLATATVLAAMSLLKQRSLVMALLAGALGGLATSTKYNGALLCIPIAFAALLPSAGMPWWPDRGRWQRLGAAALAMIGGFVLGTPYALLDVSTFIKDFSYETHHLAEGQFVDVGLGWVHHLSDSLRYGMGIPLLSAGILGIIFGFYKDYRQSLVLYSFPLVYYLFIGRGETAFFRYILPVVPFLCMAAGALVGRFRYAWGLALMVALPSIFSSLSALRIMGQGDTRDAMGAWIEGHLPNGAVLVHAGTYSGAPMLQRNVENQTREYAAKAGRADVAGFRKPDDPRWYDRSRPSYDVLFVQKEGIDFASQVPMEKILAEPPAYLLVEDYFLIHYSSVPDALGPFLQAHYTLLHEETAWNGVVSPVFDQQDAFYLPVDGFSGFERMGPSLRLYALNAPPSEAASGLVPVP